MPDSIHAGMGTAMENATRLPSLLAGMLIGALAIGAMGGHAGAQTRELVIGEQPGVVSGDETLPAALQRQAVFYRTAEPPGTIIVDVVYRYLYLVQENSRAIRYGIGVGRDGFDWQGVVRGGRKAVSPNFTASPGFLMRQPNLPPSVVCRAGSPISVPLPSFRSAY